MAERRHLVEVNEQIEAALSLRRVENQDALTGALALPLRGMISSEKTIHSFWTLQWIFTCAYVYLFCLM